MGAVNLGHCAASGSIIRGVWIVSCFHGILLFFPFERTVKLKA